MLDYISLQHSLYGPPSQAKLSFLQARQQQSQQMLQGYQSAHIQQAQVLYNAFNSDEAIQKAKLLVSQTESILNQDHLFTLNKSNYQHVNSRMQQYMMANPKIYDKYQKQLIDGYSSGFVDTNPMREPEKRVDYLHVTSGIITKDTEVIRHSFTSKENPLDSLDKFSILKSWENAISMLMDDIDFTDI